MSGNQGPATFQDHYRIASVLSVHQQSSLWRKIHDRNAALNLRLNDVVIHCIAQVAMRPEEEWQLGQEIGFRWEHPG